MVSPAAIPGSSVSPMAVPEITDVDLVVVPCAQRETETGRQRWGEEGGGGEREFMDFNFLSTAWGHHKKRDREIKCFQSVGRLCHGAVQCE